MHKKAFTLIELLIVVAIIGILTMIAVIFLQDSQAKARDTKRKADIKAIAAALEAYKANKGVILPDCHISGTPTIGRSFYKIDRLDNKFGCTGDESTPTTPTLLNLLTENYLSSQPSDPKLSDTSSPGYYYRSNSDNYKIISNKPELLTGADSATCPSIAGEYYDPKNPCGDYQVSSNSSATEGW